jgi:geranylgeranyl pyrophosphate synthase
VTFLSRLSRRRLAEPLDGVILDDVILEAGGADDANLARMSLELPRRGGKRLRPLLLTRCAEFGTVVDPRLVAVAAAIELLHVGSLYHDDVMDAAATRRGAPSANSLWGNTNATIAGTHLLARAMALLAPLPQPIVSVIAEAVFTVSTGQLRETEHAFDVDLAEDEHLQIIRMKTATLFELPCRLGARLSAADPAHVEALSQYGRDLGIAFQLVDDLLDLVGDPAVLGKPTGSDLRQGVFSHAVLLAVRRQPKGRLAELLRRADLTAEEAGRAVALVSDSGAVDSTVELAGRYADQAARALAALPDRPARAALRAIADQVVARAS